MIFNQPLFLFLFLPITLAGFFLVPAGSRALWLLAASAVFYGVSGLEHLAVLAAGIVWTWYATRTDAIRGSRIRLAIAVAGPLVALGYYKYASFLFGSIFGREVEISPEAFSLFSQVLLPAGISFFTFQLIAYAIDRYRGDLSYRPALSAFALYISFFPQLVAGPILRYQDIARRLAALAAWRPEADHLTRALGYCVAGLAAKVLIADNLNYYLAPLVADPGALSRIDAFYAILAYSFQLYFDFYGYSLVAIGLGQLFGFQFPANFLRPYEAANIREFWRRWHRTLSYWLRDYLYLPLGGNRHYVRNIIIIFVAAGLWHGAGLTFIAWGLYHAALVVAYHFTAPVWDRAPRFLQVALTFLLVSFGWTLFAFDFSGAALLFSSLAAGDAATTAHIGPTQLAVLMLAAGVCFAIRIEHIVERFGSRGGFAYQSVLAGIFLLSLVFLDRTTTFIYFRF